MIKDLPAFLELFSLLWLHVCCKLSISWSHHLQILFCFVLFFFLFQPWVPLKYHGSKSDLSTRYLQRMVEQNSSPIQFTMNPYGFYFVSDTCHLCCFMFLIPGRLAELMGTMGGNPLISSTFKPSFLDVGGPTRSVCNSTRDFTS